MATDKTLQKLWAPVVAQRDGCLDMLTGLTIQRVRRGFSQLIAQLVDGSDIGTDLNQHCGLKVQFVV